MYIHAKNFNAAAPIMAKITSSKLQLQFAKAKEAEGKYTEAVQAYRTAGDVNSVVRLCMGPLNQPQKAFEVVRQGQSITAADLLAKYCMQEKNFQVRGYATSSKYF